VDARLIGEVREMAIAEINNEGITIKYGEISDGPDDIDVEILIDILAVEALADIGWTEDMLDEHTDPDAWIETKEGMIQLFSWKDGIMPKIAK
jgi:hypothetical protein